MIAKIVAAVALAVGLTLGAVTPASAHHTHSPSQICAETRHAGTTLISAWNDLYNSSGHPLRAQCNYRNNITFALHCHEVYYFAHTVYENRC